MKSFQKFRSPGDGTMLRTIRLSRGWSLEKLAIELSAELNKDGQKGVSAAAIGKWERGESNPRPATVNALNTLLNLGLWKDASVAASVEMEGDTERWCGYYVLYRVSYDEKHIVCALLNIYSTGKSLSYGFTCTHRSWSKALQTVTGEAIVNGSYLNIIGNREDTGIYEMYVFMLPAIGIDSTFLHGVCLTTTYPGLPYCSNVYAKRISPTEAEIIKQENIGTWSPTAQFLPQQLIRYIGRQDEIIVLKII